MPLERFTSNKASKTSKRQEESRKLELLLKNVILDHCEANKVFGPEQSAFRAHRCSTENLHVLTQHISEAYQGSEML